MIARFFQIVLVGVNFLLLIFGLVCQVVALSFRSTWDESKAAFSETLQSSGDMAIVAAISFGSVIMVVSFLGCSGACFEYKLLLFLYAFIVILLVMTKTVVLAIMAAGADVTTLNKQLVESMQSYSENMTDGRSKAWSAVFIAGNCCGVNGYKADFADNYNSFGKCTKARKANNISESSNIPLPCCQGITLKDLTEKGDGIFKFYKQCLENPNSDNANLQGCSSLIQDAVDNVIGYIIGIAIPILLIELTLAGITIYLLNQLNK